MGSGSSKKKPCCAHPRQPTQVTATEGETSAFVPPAAAGQRSSSEHPLYTIEKPKNGPSGHQEKGGAVYANAQRGQVEMADKVETVLCKEGDLKNGEMREFTIEEAKVLLVRDRDRFHAVGGKCTHYGAGLSKGAYSNGYVRCPWHGACFNVETGDIEDFPGLDSLQCFQVKVERGEVVLVTSRKQLSESKRSRAMCRVDDNLVRDEIVVIVGGGGAAAACAESLRQNNFAGRIIMITQELCLPYDRPKLSKALDAGAESLQLRTKAFYDTNHIEIRSGQPVVSVNFDEKKVLLADETAQPYKYLVLATGGRPRTLRCPGSELKHVFCLRSPTDGMAIAQCVPEKHVVVLGSSFIGMEVASWAVGKKAASVTVVCQSQTPYIRTFGAEIGTAVKKLFISNGVKFELGVEIEKLIGDENGSLSNVLLKNGVTLKADVLIAGIGVEPATDFVRHSGLRMNDRGYIQVNARLQTSDPAVYACGDIVEFPLSSFGDQVVNVQHWQMALKHGKVAGQAIAGRPANIKTVPYFWTVLFGKSIRYTGYAAGYDKLVIHGSLDELKFVAYFLKNGKLVATATLGRDPVATQIAECFRNAIPIFEADIEKNGSDDWAHYLLRV